MIPKNWFISILAIIFLVGIGALMVWTFLEGRREVAIEREREHPVKTKPRVRIQDGESVVTLDKPIQIKSGIVVAPLQPISHQKELKAYGTIMELQNIIDLRNNYARAKAQWEKAKANLEASRKEYERLKALHENERNISDKVLQAVQASWLSDQANVRIEQETLHALEGIARQQWGTVISGWLFDASPAFVRLIDQQDYLIQITLPPGAQVLSAPKTALVQTADSTLVSARLVSPSPRTDPRIQGLSFFYVTPNCHDCDGRRPAQPVGLLPGMNVIAYLPVGSRVRGVLVPDSAVVWWQGKAWVYIQKKPDRFVRREISTEILLKGGWFVEKGLADGEQIVVRGAQLVLSEEFRSHIPEIE